MLANSSASEHPRVCGENTGVVWAATAALRNIPAYAGKTAIIALVYAVAHGTSPRMRGKQLSYPLNQASSRNIPAYAGKTYYSSR